MFKEVLIKEIMFSGTLGVIVDMRGSKTLNCKSRVLLHVLRCRLLELLLVGLVTLERCCSPACPCHDFLISSCAVLVPQPHLFVIP